MAQNDAASEVARAARELADIEDGLRDVHGPPVVETRTLLVFADEEGNEHEEIAKFHNDEHGTDVSRSDVSEWMHEKAREVYGREQTKTGGDPWAVADPVVVLKE